MVYISNYSMFKEERFGGVLITLAGLGLIIALNLK